MAFTSVYCCGNTHLWEVGRRFQKGRESRSPAHKDSVASRTPPGLCQAAQWSSELRAARPWPLGSVPLLVSLYLASDEHLSRIANAHTHQWGSPHAESDQIA